MAEYDFRPVGIGVNLDPTTFAALRDRAGIAVGERISDADLCIRLAGKGLMFQEVQNLRRSLYVRDLLSRAAHTCWP